MEHLPASRHRQHFRFIVPSVYPVLIVHDGEKKEVIIVNEGASLRIGHSGSIATAGMYFPTGGYHKDTYSMDGWWAIALSSSGSLSGYIVY